MMSVRFIRKMHTVPSIQDMRLHVQMLSTGEVMLQALWRQRGQCFLARHQFFAGDATPEAEITHFYALARQIEEQRCSVLSMSAIHDDQLFRHVQLLDDFKAWLEQP